MPPPGLPRLEYPEWLEFSVALGQHVLKRANDLGVTTPLAEIAAWFAGFVGAAAYAGFPGPGLELKAATPEAEAKFRELLREEAKRSPMFRDLLLEIGKDTKHPVSLSLESRSRIFVDEWGGGGRQQLDLADLALWPADPPPDHPEAMTRGEHLMHTLFEARQGALGGNNADSHAKAVEAENAYRKERGQGSALLMPPDDVKQRPDTTTTPPTYRITFQFDNGYREEVVSVISKEGELLRADPIKIVRHAPAPTP